MEKVKMDGSSLQRNERQTSLLEDLNDDVKRHLFSFLRVEDLKNMRLSSTRMFCDLLTIVSFLLPVLAATQQYGGDSTTSLTGSGRDYQHAVGHGCAVLIPDKGRRICVEHKLVDMYFWKSAKRADLESILESEGSGDAEATLENPTSDYLAVMANVLLETTKAIAEKFDLNQGIVLKYLPMIDTMRTSIDQFCPSYLKHFDCSDVKVNEYRTFSGVCNNLNNPDWGMAKHSFSRFMDPSYADGISEWRASVTGNPMDLPSPRLVSIMVHQDLMMDDTKTNFLWVSFCQLVTHDISRRVPQTLSCCDTDLDYFHRDCRIIDVPKYDVFLQQFDTSCIGFARDPPTPTTFCKLGPRTQFNGQSATLDHSVNYGVDEEDFKLRFRTGQDGKLVMEEIPSEQKESMGTLRILPCSTSCESPPCEPPCTATSGDGRTSEQPGLVLTHWIFWALHNYICDNLSGDGCSGDEECFQMCRKITTAIYQHIIYNEYLPLLFGLKWMKMHHLFPSKGFTHYNREVNPSTSNVISSAAMRYGHAFLPGFVELRNPDDLNHVEFEKLSDVLRKPFNLNTLWLIMGQALQPSHIKGPSMTDELKNKMFKDVNGRGMDLASINIARGRDHGIPSYNKWRKYCGMKPVNTWEEAYIVMIPEYVDEYKKIYLTPEDLDLWSAGLSERIEDGGKVGPVFSCIIAKQFAHYKFGDRFYYEHQGQFTAAQLDTIKEVRMSTLLCLLSEGGIHKIQPWAFVLPNNQKNPLTSCDSLPELDLDPWLSFSSSPSPPTYKW